MENNYYIYFHTNLECDEVFYVGKGKDKRAWSKAHRSQHWKNVVNKYGYKVEIIHKNLSEKTAFELEKSYIKILGREDLGEGYLVNHTDGGEGQSGIIRSDETRKKMSYANKGKNPWITGKKHSKETCEKITEKILGKNNSQAVKIKYNNTIYNSIIDLWKNEFLSITESAFRSRVNKGKIIFERI